MINGTQRKCQEGHPWIYATQIDRSFWSASPNLEPVASDLAEAIDFRGRYLGTGIYNPVSMIAVRLLTHRHETVDADLIRRRVREAIAWRRQGMRPDTEIGRAHV